jgi:uracil phosphoribosyltransferase
MLHILDKENNTLLNNFVAELRDVNIQKDSMRFRRNLERIGEIMAYEISKHLNYKPNNVETPLGEAVVMMPCDDVVVATIFRAGIPFHQGFLNYFDRAENGFISAYRHHSKDGSFKIKMEYVASPDLTGKTLLLVDPMLATGQSLVVCYEALVERCGEPAVLHAASVIGSEQGVEYAVAHLPRNAHVWCASVDEELTVHSYIVPGLGDAGDLAYGKKL